MDETRIKIDGEILNNLRFTDDVVIIAENVDDLEKIGEEFANRSEEAGLQMNGEKTVTLFRRPKRTIKIKDTEITELNEVTYLGQSTLVKNKREK